VRLGPRHGLASHRRRWIELNCRLDRAVRRADPLLYFKVLKMADWTEFEGEPSVSPRYPGAGWALATTELQDKQSAPFHYVHKQIDVPIGPVYYALAR
jgi:hypothetical protein